MKMSIGISILKRNFLAATTILVALMLLGLAPNMLRVSDNHQKVDHNSTSGQIFQQTQSAVLKSIASLPSDNSSSSTQTRFKFRQVTKSDLYMTFSRLQAALYKVINLSSEQRRMFEDEFNKISSKKHSPSRDGVIEFEQAVENIFGKLTLEAFLAEIDHQQNLMEYEYLARELEKSFDLHDVSPELANSARSILEMLRSEKVSPVNARQELMLWASSAHFIPALQRELEKILSSVPSYLERPSSTFALEVTSESKQESARFSSILQLDSDQSERVSKILAISRAEFEARLNEIKSGSQVVPWEDMIREFKVARRDFEAKLVTIVTPEQFIRYKNMRDSAAFTQIVE